MSLTAEQMLGMQRDLQIRYGGVDPGSLDGDMRADYIRTMILATEDELHEALAETGWKPWASSRHLNRAEYKGELVDAWHFFMNLLLVANITWDEFSLAYEAKNKVNHSRIDQGDGYDGIAGKCPGCRRDLGDLRKADPFRTFFARGASTFCSESCYLSDGAAQ